MQIKKTFFSQIARFFHRLLLPLHPSYVRHRTPEQKQFDSTIQSFFFTCLLIICLVIFLAIFYKGRRNDFLPITEEETFIEEKEKLFPEEDSVIITDESLILPIETNTTIPLIDLTNEKIDSLEMTLRKKETLSGLLTRAKIPLAKALTLSNALELIFDVKKLRAGQTFELFFIKDDFQGIKFETNKGEIISVLKNIDGDFLPQNKEGVIENKIYVLQGVIDKSFSVSASKTGIPKAVINQAILALNEIVDFSKDIKQGLPYKVIYEQKMTQSGKKVGRSQLLYVSLQTKTSLIQRYFFIDSMGIKGFYDENGQSTPQKIMQRPLGKGRISSHFGGRIHPILGYRIQHKGVDFPAPVGTPIPAGADGIIQKMTRNGGYGKFVQIKHNATYTTCYGHLYNYNEELKVGSYVKKGEIIGYVGNTGRSTGPHLHYEVLQNKIPVNPLKEYTLPQRTLKNQSLAQFKLKKSALDILELTEPYQEATSNTSLNTQ